MNHKILTHKTIILKKSYRFYLQQFLFYFIHTTGQGIFNFT